MTRVCNNHNVDYEAVMPYDFRAANELPTVDVKTSNWKGTLISVIVILLLCSAIIFTIYIVNPEIEYTFNSSSKKEKLKLNDWLSGKYTAQSTFNGTWFSDHELTFINANGDYEMYNFDTNSSSIVVNAVVMKQYEVNYAALSPNRQFVLFASYIKNVFRHSKLARYKIFELKNEQVIIVKPNEANQDVYLQAAEWGPKNAQLVFVYERNVYYMPEPDNNKTIRLTNDNDKKINNGIPDWIYEEEIFATSTALWWSSDGTRLAFAQFNDTDVETQDYPWYGDTVDLSTQYLDNIRINYPKPGRSNPQVKLFVVNLNEDTNNIRLVDPPSRIKEEEYYLTTVAWGDSNSLIAVWFNRLQNYASFSVCTPYETWQCLNNYEHQVSNGWVEITRVHVDPQLENYYVLLGDQTPWQNVQIVKVNIKTRETKYLTQGRQDVINILKVVRRNLATVVYYLSTKEGKPGERHLFSVEERSSLLKTDISQHDNSIYSDFPQQYIQRTNYSHLTYHCYTCDRIELNFNNSESFENDFTLMKNSQYSIECLCSRVSLSQNATYFVQECLGPEIPFSVVRKISSTNNNNKNNHSDVVKIWEYNEKIRETLSNKLLPKIRTEIINSPNNEYGIIVQLMLPPLLKEDEIVKYPLLVQVYGGPGSQNVNENYKMNFGKVLSSNKNIIYAYIDGRGSGYQGNALKYSLFHQLGTVEVEDQIYAVKELLKKYKFINKEAVGIWGWSYGGYATAMVLAKDDQNEPVFSCGISVAPVTSWLLYDSAYTERFMGLPGNNSVSYFNSDVMHLVNNFKNKKKFLLIHGTADDNVHIQNSMTLIKALNMANVMFQTQIYPDENHSLSGVNQHLYQTMEKFWNDCYQSDFYTEDIGLRRRRVYKDN